MRSVLLLSILSGTRAQNLDVSGAEIKEGESATLSCTPRGSGTPESGKKFTGNNPLVQMRSTVANVTATVYRLMEPRVQTQRKIHK